MKYKTFSIIFVLLFATQIFAQTREDYYSKSSSSFLLNDLQTLLKSVEGLDQNTRPEETKELRKEIGNLKLKIDFFMFAYPETKINKKDHLNLIRDELDRGYTNIGYFKDLYDAMVATGESEIDQDEVERLLSLGLQWKEQFIFNVEEREDFEFLAKPSTKKVHLVKEREFPRLVWGAVDYRPKNGDSLGDVADQLTSSMLKVVSTNLEELEKVEDLGVHKNEEFFHDTRKILRNALKFNQYFESIMAQESEELATLDSVVDGFGEINDLLIALHSEKNKDKKEKLLKNINSQWKSFKRTIKDKDIKKLIKKMT